MKAERIIILVFSFMSIFPNSGITQDIEHKTIDRDYWRNTKKTIYADPAESSNGFNDTWPEEKDPDFGKRDGKGGLGKYKRELESSRRKIPGKKDEREIISYERKKSEETEPPQRNYSGSINVPSWLGYVFLGILAAVLIFLLFKYFTGVKWGGGKKLIPVSGEYIPDPVDLPETELQRMLRELLGSSHYREAVRIWFITIIKKLRDRDLIEWQKKKTNSHYIRELKDHPEGKSFEKAAWLFERIWYGKIELSKEQYQQVEPDFRLLLERLEKSSVKSGSTQTINQE